jgi:hypothetical protein
MVDEFKLFKARELANGVRYSKDQHDKNLGLQPFSLNEVVDDFYRSAVEIHENITPVLENSLKMVCDRLQLDRSAITAFVNSSHDLQAACYYTDQNQCLIRISSALVNLLEPEEFEFVLGHELGHFLLQHAPTATSKNTAEHFVFQRAKEISADRIGLLGCGDYETAAKTLIKTASGLESRFINLDVEHYLSQLKRLAEPQKGENPFGTHPSILVRTSAVAEFAKDRTSLSYEEYSTREIFEIDERLSHNLDKYVDGHLRNMLKETKNDLEMWLAARKMADDGRLDKDEQRVFASRFGDELLAKLKQLLETIEAGNVLQELDDRISICNTRLENMAPSEFQRNFAEVKSDVNKLFRSS